MRVDANTWLYSTEHRQPCLVIERQEVWGRSSCRVWLPSTDSTIRIDASTLLPLSEAGGWSKADLAEYNQQRFNDLVSAGWDLVIVDESHRLGGSTDQVARFKLGKGLAEASPYLLLLSATPHQGKTDAFRRIVSLLDDAAFPA